MKYWIFCIFFFYLDLIFCQSITDHGYTLFEKIKGKTELQEDISTLINSSTNDFENKNNFQFLSELYMYALLYEYEEKYNESIQVLNSLSCKLNIEENNKDDFIKIQFKLGLLFQSIELIDSANVKFEMCISLIKNSIGVKNDFYCAALEESASCLSDLYLYDKATDRYIEALKLTKRFSANDLKKITRLMNDMALNYHRMGNFNESIKINKECLAIRYKTFGESYPGYLMTLNNLASDYMAIGNYKQALDLNQKCLVLRKKYLGESHYHTLMSLNNLGTLSFSIGNYEKSKEYFEEVLTILDSNGKKNSVEFISTYLGLSDNYEVLNLYAKALEIRNSCLEINNKIGNNHSFIYSCIITKLSSSYYSLDFLDKAEEKLLECLSIREKLFGINHIQYAETISNLAMIYKAMGEFDKALKYIDSSYKIGIEKYGENHADNFYALAHKAQVYSDMGDFEKAIYFANQALKGYQRIFGKESETYSRTLGDIGYYQTRLKQFDLAEKTLTKSLNIKKKIFPLENNIIENAYNNLATVHLLTKNYKAFLENQNFILESIRKEFNSNQLLFTNEQKESFKYKLSDRLLSLISVIAKPETNSKEFQEDILDFWFDSNGLLSSQKSELIYQLDENDTLFKRLWDDYKQANSIYYYYKEKPFEYAKKAGVEIENLKNNAEESQIKVLKQLDKNHYSQKPINYNSIKSSLSDNESFIEIIRIPSYNYLTNKWIDSSTYLGLLINKKNDRPEIINIENSSDFDKINFPSYCFSTFSDKKDRAILDSSGHFYKAFWEVFDEKIQPFKTIYISLGGVYNNINLNTLFNPKTNNFLLEEKDIHIVNSARDFVLKKEKEKKNFTNNTIALFGFPNFDGNTISSQDSLNYYVTTRDLNTVWLDSLTRGGINAKPLPATKTEIENISKTLGSKGWKINSFLAENATEFNLKKQQSPRVLHIATHGYFFPDIPMVDKDQTRFLGMDRQQVAQDPMLRSGLLLTGANRTLKGEVSTGENGLLSAAEASLLDLRETELVVLSACETGKGEVKNSEGVYGLRKAFSDAGAQNIIMSLWKVDDKVTQEFMTRFYQLWLNDKTTIREAFHKTQLEIKAKYPQPYFWGAFILVGE